MPQRFGYALFFVALISTNLLSAQPTGPSPVAFVYVSSSTGNNSYQINAFAADASGRLTMVAGSPFAGNTQSVAVNQHYLFGTDGVYIYSFAIAPDGTLTPAASVNAQGFNDDGCGGPVGLFLDRAGTTLYDPDYYANICANNTYQFFNVSNPSGDLSYLGMSDPSALFDVSLSFTGNNLYAYGATSYHMEPDIFGFRRNDDGSLTLLPIDPPMPKAPSGQFYDPYLTAADGANHVAISVQPYDANTWQPSGPAQFATFTADNSGNLSTQSNYSNMPATAVGYVSDLAMSLSGQFLAVAGTTGLQVFKFNGASPITPFTQLLAHAPITQLSWDASNHLYAISSTGKLFVFTVTAASVGVYEAPGSPYAVTSPQGIAVLSK